MSRILLYISLALLLLGQGCRKPKEYVVNGEILEYYDRFGVGEANVEVAYAPVSYGTVNGGYEVITSAQTNAEGQYELAFEFVPTASFRLRVRKDGYIMAEEEVSADSWSTDEENSWNSLLVKAASFKINLVNNGVPNGRMLLQFRKHSVECSYCCKYTDSYLFEGYFDTTFTCSVYGNQYIQYIITKVDGNNAVVEEYGVDVDQGEYTLHHEF